MINGEKAVREAGLGCRVIPVPRSVSPMCGMALEIDDEDESEVDRLLGERSIKTDVFDRAGLRL